MVISKYTNSMVKHFEFDENMKALLSEVAAMSELMEEIRHEWCNQNLQDCSEADKISQCIMQMMTLKIQSVLRLCEGVQLPAYQPQPIFLDSASIVALLRCIYEEVFFFHNIFATESGIEKSILINIWKIKGLSNQIYARNQKKDSNEQDIYPEKVYEYSDHVKQKVEKIKCEIETLFEQLGISEDVRTMIRSNMKPDRSIKGYRFVREGNIIVKFEQIGFASSPEEVFGTMKLNPLYRLLSAHSHPSYLGVEKFGTMYNAGGDMELLRMTLRGICVMSAIFIKDFLKSVQNGGLIDKRLSNIARMRINSYSQVS